MIEIERKFLVTNTLFKDQAFKSVRIIQGFLNTDPERTVRIRLKDAQGILTVKGKSASNGLSRFEWETNISKKEALALLELSESVKIDKTRYLIQHKNHIFEVDVFHSRNTGLVVAEVELNSEDEVFSKPKWLGKEVTGELKYYNSQLSKQPYDTWK